jgi:hypothetical protein
MMKKKTTVVVVFTFEHNNPTKKFEEDVRSSVRHVDLQPALALTYDADMIGQSVRVIETTTIEKS